MSNGRTGGFILRRDELERVLDDMEYSGTVAHDDQERRITASDIRAILDRWGDDSITIEEHHGSWYIIQLDEWVTVDETDALHAVLRELHRGWSDEMDGKEAVSADRDLGREREVNRPPGVPRGMSAPSVRPAAGGFRHPFPDELYILFMLGALILILDIWFHWSVLTKVGLLCGGFVLVALFLRFASR